MMQFKVLYVYSHLASKATLGDKQQRDASRGTHALNDPREAGADATDGAQEHRLPFNLELPSTIR